MSINTQQVAATLESIAARIRDHQISLEELYVATPDEVNESAFLAEVVEDFEDTLEHLPKKWFSNGSDTSAWESSYEYWRALVDCAGMAALAAGATESEVAVRRRNALRDSHGKSDVENANRFFADLLN